MRYSCRGDHIVAGFQVGLTFVIWDGRGLREHLGRRGTPSYPEHALQHLVTRGKKLLARARDARCVHGYLAHKKQPLRRTLQYDYA